VASGADGVAQVDDGVLVAVCKHLRDLDKVAGRFTLAPALAAAAAVECGQAGVGFVERGGAVSCVEEWRHCFTNIMPPNT